MLNLLLSFLLPVTHCDAPEPWQLYFQEAATPTMEGIVNFHNQTLNITNTRLNFYIPDIVSNNRFIWLNRWHGNVVRI